MTQPPDLTEAWTFDRSLTDVLTHADASKTKTQFTLTRTLLQRLATPHGTLSEGDLVSVSGFLHRAEQGSAAETVASAAAATTCCVTVRPQTK
jgi:hypothetical protein